MLKNHFDFYGNEKAWSIDQAFFNPKSFLIKNN